MDEGADGRAVQVHLFQRRTNRVGFHLHITVEPQDPGAREVDSETVPASARDIVDGVKAAVASFEESSNPLAQY